MRTLHVNDVRTWGGGEQQTLYLAAGLARRGHETLLAAAPASPLLVRARAAGLEAADLAVRGEADLLGAWRLARLLRRFRPDVLHCHTAHAFAAGIVARALAGRPRAPIVVARRLDYSIFRHSFLRLNGLKYRRAARVVAVSACVRDILLADGVDPARVALVHSGVDPARLAAIEPRDLRAELGLPREAKVVVNVASLVPHKGQVTFVEAAKEVVAARPATFFAIVGDGKERPRLEARIRELGLERRVRLLGFREDAAAILKGADVFAMPSHTEALGTVVLDALACGVPVVAARAGGIPEMIEHERNGLLVAPRDAGALARAILCVLDDEALAARLRAAGPATLEGRFTADAMVEGTIAVYESVLAGAPPRRPAAPAAAASKASG